MIEVFRFTLCHLGLNVWLQASNDGEQEGGISYVHVDNRCGFTHSSDVLVGRFVVLLIKCLMNESASSSVVPRNVGGFTELSMTVVAIATGGGDGGGECGGDAMMTAAVGGTTTGGGGGDIEMSNSDGGRVGGGDGWDSGAGVDVDGASVDDGDVGGDDIDAIGAKTEDDSGGFGGCLIVFGAFDG